MTRIVGPRHREDSSVDTVARELRQRTNIIGIMIIDTDQIVALPQQAVLRRVRDGIRALVLMDFHNFQSAFGDALLRPVQPYPAKVYSR